MKILLVGAEGGLGLSWRSYARRFAPGAEIQAFGRKHLDVTDAFAIEKILTEHNAHLFVNCSGYTAVDLAEKEKDQAFAVNAQAVATMAELCARASVPFVTYSTDYVFGGNTDRPLTESDPTNPSSVYGQSKRAGEIEALKFSTSLVLRTSWLYSEEGKSFPRTILTRALQGQPLKVVDDQISAPTWSPDLIEASLTLCKKNARGLFHYSCEGETSWFGLATHSLELYNRLKNARLPPPKAIKTKELSLAAPRPAYSKLDCTKAIQMGVRVRPWSEALEDFMKSLLARPDWK